MKRWLGMGRGRYTFATTLLIVFEGQVTRLSRSTTHAVATLARAASVREVHFIVDAGMRAERASVRSRDCK